METICDIIQTQPEVYHPSMIFVNNCVHMILKLAHENYYQHMTWNYITKEEKVVHTFDKLDAGACNFIYLKQRNQFMLL